MEKFKIVIKGKYGIDKEGNKSLDFETKGNGDPEVLMNALADSLCEIALDNGLELKELVDDIKFTYKRCVKEREEDK